MAEPTSHLTLEALGKLTVAQLRAICKERKITGYTKLHKPALIQEIHENVQGNAASPLATVSPHRDSSRGDQVDVIEPSEKADKTGDTKVVLHSTEGLAQELRSAFALQRAINLSISKIPAIGYTMTAYERDVRPSKTHQIILRALRALYDETPRPYKSGKLKHKFNLTITRSGCEYSGAVNKIDDSHLESWYKNGVISGYGDNRALETKIDDSVRDAREIVSNEFSVDEQLLEEITSVWKKNFKHANVRASPYKIHIYGPGGHFKSHRDTPEEGLIGTFLVGLGETTSLYQEGCFHIGQDSYRADPRSWVAFYPDIPHSISALPPDHFRASIAFKIFSCGDSDDVNSASAQQLQLQSRVDALLHAIPRPFGILLDHAYHLGITELNGYDKILLSGAQSRPDSIIHLLPVIISTRSEVWDEDVSGLSEKPSYEAGVIPFHPAHIDILNNRSTPVAEQAVEFLKHIRNVPFFCRDFHGTAGLWRQEIQQGGYAGNESEGDRESSLYLSHALLVLPAVGDKGSE